MTKNVLSHNNGQFYILGPQLSSPPGPSSTPRAISQTISNPRLVGTVLFHNPRGLHCNFPAGLGKSSIPLHLFPTLVFQSHRVCSTIRTKQQGYCTCFRAFDAFNATQHWQLPVPHRTWARMIFSSMECIVSQAPKSNQAAELPVCCGTQDAPICLLLGEVTLTI